MKTVNKEIRFSPFKSTAWGEAIKVTNDKDVAFLINAFGNLNDGIPSEKDREAAAFITTACNNYYPMLEALKRVAAFADSNKTDNYESSMVRQIKAAIKAAEQENQ